MTNIKLHPKYGLNPTIPICFFCGKEIGDIILLGASYKNEAPKNMCMNKEPCQKCKDNMALGIAFIEYTEQDGPTGTWLVMKEEAVRKIINNEYLLKQILDKRKAFVHPKDWTAIGLPRENSHV